MRTINLMMITSCERLYRQWPVLRPAKQNGFLISPLKSLHQYLVAPFSRNKLLINNPLGKFFPGLCLRLKSFSRFLSVSFSIKRKKYSAVFAFLTWKRKSFLHYLDFYSLGLKCFSFSRYSIYYPDINNRRILLTLNMQTVHKM